MLQSSFSARAFRRVPRGANYLPVVLFGNGPIHCPTAASCYCNVFGLCDLTCETDAGCKNRYVLPRYSTLPDGWPYIGWDGQPQDPSQGGLPIIVWITERLSSQHNNRYHCNAFPSGSSSWSESWCCIICGYCANVTSNASTCSRSDRHPIAISEGLATAPWRGTLSGRNWIRCRCEGMGELCRCQVRRLIRLPGSSIKRARSVVMVTTQRVADVYM